MSEIAEYSFVEEALNELSIQYKEVPDANTKEGHKACKDGAKAVGKYRIALESKRKEIKGPALEKCKAIDEEAKRIQLVIADIESPLKLAYKSVDEENKRLEEERVSKILAIIDGMTTFIDMATTGTPETISEWIEQVEEIDCTDKAIFAEFSRDAALERNRVLEVLQVELRRTIQQETDDKKRREQDAELEELRAKQKERDEEIERLRQVEKDKETEKQLIEQQDQAEIAAEQAEEKHLKDVEQAVETARLEEIQRQENEKEAELNRIAKLEANKKHVGKIRKEAKTDLMEILGVEEKLAVSIVMAITKKLISNISINY